jgi:mono/diheme cytochrome c family protein
MAKTMKVVSFKDPTMVKATDAQFIASTKNGKNKMPAYAGKLTDPQITDVVAYIRTLQK